MLAACERQEKLLMATWDGVCVCVCVSVCVSVCVCICTCVSFTSDTVNVEVT